MKILLDARFYGLEHAGLGRYTINLIHELSKIDTQNEYVILLRKKYFESLMLPKNWEKVKVEAKHYWFKEQALVPLVIRKYKPEVVHFLHSNIPVFYNKPFVVTIHDLTMYRQGIEATTLPLPMYYAKRIPFKMVFRKAIKDSQKIIVPTYAVKDDIVQTFKVSEDKIIVTYEGVHEDLPTTVSHTNILQKHNILHKKYVLYVGNSYPHKNIKRAIEAVTMLQKNDNVQFVIVSGRGVFRERLESEIKKQKAEEFVKILDYVTDEELSVLYKNALTFLYPSLSEGFGLPGLEAMQNGTLLCASDTNVFKEVYKGHVLYFDPKNSDSIVNALQKVLSMKERERGKRITDAKEYVKEFTWKKTAKKTLSVYQSLTR